MAMEKEVYEDTHYYKTVCEFSTSTSYTFLYDKNRQKLHVVWHVLSTLIMRHGELMRKCYK